MKIFTQTKSYYTLAFTLFLTCYGFQIFAQPGKDESVTITTNNTVLNRYTRVVADIVAGSNNVTVTNINDLNRDAINYLPAGYTTAANGFKTNPLTPGDLIMIYQAQGAKIDTTNTVNYGTVQNYNGAGRYEFAYVGTVSGNEITLQCGSKFSYFAANYIQLIRVPQYNTLTVSSGASVVPVPWGSSSFGTDPDYTGDINGVTREPSSKTRRRGGFTAIHASQVVNNGIIQANGAGFRGGTTDPYTVSPAGSKLVWAYREKDPQFGAEKGESIAGYREDYEDKPFNETVYIGRWGRGAPANGGGGGNAHNAGGGGGANGGVLANWFRGAGVMNDFSGTCGNPGAWIHDPLYMANNNQLTNSSGGGRGGYTFGGIDNFSNFVDENACLVGPSYAANEISPGFPATDLVRTSWAGDYRVAVGGLGGRPVIAESVRNQLFFGGGGGSGDGNDNANSDGGNGGGILFLIVSGNITGSGELQANGANAPDTRNTHNDAPGGGGGGGTVLIQANSLAATLTIHANGGKGGSQFITNIENEGPGGGGGGGVIAINAVNDNIPATQKKVDGGKNGITTSPALAEFPSNGATSGNSGSFLNIPVKIDVAECAADLSVSKTAGTTDPKVGSNIIFTITAANNGPGDANLVKVTESLPSGYTFVSSTLTSGTYNGTQWAIPYLPVGGTETLTITATVKASGVYSNTATITFGQTDPNANNNQSTSTPIVIYAVNDNGTVNTSIGGTAISNILVNDLLNGTPATTTNVNIIQTSPIIPGVTLNPANGQVTVAAGTAPNTYTLTYQITDKANPAVTTAAVINVTVTASTVIALDNTGTINGLTGGVAIPNILDNDTFNGQAASLANVTINQVSSTSPAVRINSNGEAIVDPGTPAGTYTIVYRIADKVVPANSSQANVIITVSAPAIQANDDAGNVYGYPGGTAVANVLVNDTYNGSLATLATVTIAQVATTNPGVTVNSNGEAVVAPQTLPGIYDVTYRITDRLNPANFDLAVVKVTVIPSTISAVNDEAEVDGLTSGTAISNILANDLLNGRAATVSNVIISEVTATGPTDNRIAINENTGSVDVAAGVNPNTYTFTYRITDRNNPSNTTTATIRIVVPGKPMIGIAKEVTSLQPQPDGTFNVSYRIIVKNYGNIQLTNIEINDNLVQTFPSPIAIKVTEISTAGTLAISSFFNGISNTNLLAAASTLLPATTGIIDFTVNIKPNGSFGTFLNKAFATASSTGGNTSDESVSGTNPDPDGNANPDEQEATPVEINPAKVYIPEGFSPNNDGVNDKFVIVSTPGDVVSLEIYNRWGNVVYKNDDYKNEWTGIANQGVRIGEVLPDGTYFYIVRINNVDKYVRYITIKR